LPGRQLPPRFLILFELMANGLRRLVYPHTVLPVRYGERIRAVLHIPMDVANGFR
jgi:hypothetical protein